MRLLRLRAVSVIASLPTLLLVSPAALAGTAPIYEPLDLSRVEPPQVVVEGTDLVVSPDGAHLYVVSAPEGAIAVYGIDDATGDLSSIELHTDGVAGLDDLGQVEAVLASPDGAHVYVAAAGDDAVTVFARDAATGRLTAVQTVRDGIGGATGLDGACDLISSPDGSHVYAIGRTSHSVVTFERDEFSGALTFVEALAPGTDFQGPEALTMTVDGLHLYVLASASDSVVVFARDQADGTLAFVEAQIAEDADVQSFQGGRDVVVSSDGAFVYALGGGDGGSWHIVTFSRDPGTGALTHADANQFTTIRSAKALVTCPSEAHVFVGGDRLRGYSRDPVTGMVSLVSGQEGWGSTVGSGGVYSLAFSPDGRWLFVGSWGGSLQVQAFAHDEVSGRTTSVAGQLSSHRVRAVASTPDGAYVLAVGSAALALLRRETGTGLLRSADSIGIFEIGAFTASPDGRFVYFLTSQGDSIRVLEIDPVRHRMDLVGELVDPAGEGLTGLWMSPDGTHVFAYWSAWPFPGSELRTYARDATTGLLAPIFAIDDSVVPELARLTALVPSADGAHLYALAGVSGEPLQILVWLRNATTGELSVVSEIPPGAGGLESYGDVAISPDGEHLYVSTFSPRRGFARFRRDPATGDLTILDVRVREEEGAEGLDAGPGLTLDAGGDLLIVGGHGVHHQSNEVAGFAFVQSLDFDIPFAERAGTSAITPDGLDVYVAPEDDGPLRAARRIFPGCHPAPLAACRTGERAKLRLRRHSAGLGANASWSLSQAEDTSSAEFDPGADDPVAFCVYDESGVTPTLVFGATAPAGGVCRSEAPCWRAATKRVLYKDRWGTPDGLVNMTLKASDADKTRIVVRSFGPFGPDVELPLGLPVRAQLQKASGLCWESAFETASSNGTSRFSAKFP